MTSTTKTALLICWYTLIISLIGVTIGRYYFPKTETKTVYIDKEIPIVETVEVVEEVETVEEVKEVEFTLRYALSDDEFQEVCQVVMAESGAECYEGQMAVAQCILNACEFEGLRPFQAVREYKYTPTRKTPTESVKRAVEAVFYYGETVTDELILYFYAPKYVHSKWHESQTFVMEIGGHRFFTLND